MNDELLKYYNCELVYVCYFGKDFVEKYLKVVGRLKFIDEVIEDFYVLRLVELFVFLIVNIR